MDTLTREATLRNVLPPLSIEVFSKSKNLLLKNKFFPVTAVFRRGLLSRNTNKKTHKLSPFGEIAEK